MHKYFIILMGKFKNYIKILFLNYQELLYNIIIA